MGYQEHKYDISAIVQEQIKNNSINLSLSTSSSKRNDIKRKKQTDKNIITDILYIHDKIKKYFEYEYNNIKEYKKKIIEILYYINENFSSDINNADILFLKNIYKKYQIDNNISNNINNINNNLSLENFKQYILDIQQLDNHLENINIHESYFNIFSESHIEKYKLILNEPSNSTFIKNKNNKLKKNTDEKTKIIKSYFTNINNYFNQEFIIKIIGNKQYNEIQKFLLEYNTNNNINKIITDNQDKETNYENDDENEFFSSTNINYNDYSRININQKYKYEKKCHFRDTINQYQGKQNKFIPQKLFNELYEIIEKHGLLIDSEDTNIKFSKVTKDHIRLFLNEIEYSKYYEDLQLIYSRLTKKPCPDISLIEKQLYEDFEKLVEAFLSLPNIDRKNFLNSHYVLRQLLLRRNIKVPENDLSILKTNSRIRDHDDIYEICCNILGWNFVPLS